MAEALALVGSVIAIVQISKTIISSCQFYMDAVDGASSDLRAILVEISTVKAIAKSLQYLAQPNVANSTLLDQLAANSGPIEGCKKALKDLEKLFPPSAVPVSGQKRRKIEVARTALAWPLKSAKAKKLLQEIIQHKTSINLALTMEFVQDLKDVKQKVVQMHTLLSKQEQRDICDWLETTNPCNIHNRSQDLYEPGTGSWILRTPEWPLWIEGKRRCLWIHGIPGAGKSILTSHIAEEVEKHCQSSSDSTSTFGFAYYYCYFGHNQDESSHFLRWVISQLCRQSSRIPNELLEVRNSGRIPDLATLLSILYAALEPFEKVYVVLDAVDESMPRDNLLRVIRDLCSDARFSSLGLIATSREYIDIEQVLETCSSPMPMSNEFVEADIRVFVHSTLQTDSKYQRWPEVLKSEMEDTIPKKANGMFRWAVCQLDILKRLRPDISRIMTALSNLPKTLDETYERIFLAIPEENRLSVKYVFYWMIYHNELLKDDIPINILLQVVQQSTLNELSAYADDLHDFEGLRESCGCLIRIQKDRERVPTLLFAHYTVKEFLQSSRIQDKEVGFFSLLEEDIRKHCSEIAFRQALAIEEYAFKEEDVELDFESCDVKLYFSISSALQLSEWPTTILSSTKLTDLSVAYVNPCRSNYDCASKIFKSYDASEDFEYLEKNFWQNEWLQISNPKSAIFLNLLCICNNFPGLGHELLSCTRQETLQFLMDQVHIKFKLYRKTEVDPTSFEMEGSTLKICAIYSSPHLNLVLDLIPQDDTSRFDLSTILLFHMGSHKHIKCPATCVLQRLLDLGAMPNGPDETFVTPLKIAVGCYDKVAVKVLLDAGANVNSTGGDNAAWNASSPMSPFNNLHGLSPLYIIRFCECLVSRDTWGFYGVKKSDAKEIKQLLLSAGAINNSSEQEEEWYSSEYDDD